MKFTIPQQTRWPEMWTAWTSLVRRLDELSEEDLDHLQHDLDRCVDKAASQASYRRYKAWVDWSRDNTADGGMRRAFRWVKQDAPWACTSTSAGPGTAKSLAQEAKDAVKPWHDLWKQGEGMDAVSWPTD